MELLKEYKDWDIVENVFTEFPSRVSICNTLRHLIPKEFFAGFEYVYITDIDFLFFRHEPTLGQYFAKRIKRCKQPYAAFRGAINVPRRKDVNKIGWKGSFTRIADGTLMLKTPEWYERTDKFRIQYYKRLKKSEHDKFDSIIPASYREYNEVMLYRICRLAGLETPSKKRHFIDGHKYDITFRDIHLGDMKYNYHKRIKKNITKWNIKNFKLLEKNKTWKALCSVCEKDGTVKTNLNKLRKVL